MAAAGSALLATPAGKAAKGVKRIFSARVLERMATAADDFHNFPQQLADDIFAGTRTVVSDNYVLYTRRGSVNGQSGTFEIGVRPSESGRTEVITHWFFNPDKH